ncbi:MULTISPECIES: pyridoxamine 5'-phosphate oxidase family protein [Reichenbachiella]|uniref:pyridoxamine 5'-phosphate oxidase family protein n=1 Tax=Reichenbachiella TaxID=156993 RepID=UPI000E6C58AB|nr:MULTISPECIES: pyridoxamine 5'-phosphate oxidase family protein [Reichenbachiella]MBU2912491.1 pyridoxamine 5'-phosphate oxidase family protein [Reichenbachiella agariperforans]RJE72645.1 flavin-nucleotide-binding protein [Reichenbachiella sp. MSK19-1]
MTQFPKEAKNKVVRGAKRATYDKETIYEILDAGFLCHISFVMNGEPFMIPTAYARSGDKIYIHGSVKSRAIKQTKAGAPICFCVTHLDGLVLARSAFHHSVNYRSAIIYGHANELVVDADKNEALHLITENFLKGRWNEVRQPNQKELDITSVLEISIESASAKIRTGSPVDDEEDYALDIWAGILPVETRYAAPVDDTKLRPGIATSPSAKLAWEESKE